MKHIHIYIQTYTCMNVYIYIYICICICMIYVYIHTRIHTHIQILYVCNVCIHTTLANKPSSCVPPEMFDQQHPRITAVKESRSEHYICMHVCI